jgi:hypothetical protein
MNNSFFSPTKEQNLNDLSESFYIRIGSTWILDSIYLYVISPLSFMAIILNALSLFIINKIKIKNATINFYEYLKVDLINGIILCLIGTCSFIGYSPRYFKYTTTLIRQFIYLVYQLYHI